MTPATVFRLGDIVITPTGQRARIVGFTEERADVQYYLDSGELSKSEGALIRPHLLRFAASPKTKGK